MTKCQYGDKREQLCQDEFGLEMPLLYPAPSVEKICQYTKCLDSPPRCLDCLSFLCSIGIEDKFSGNRIPQCSFLKTEETSKCLSRHFSDGFGHNFRAIKALKLRVKLSLFLSPLVTPVWTNSIN